MRTIWCRWSDCTKPTSCWPGAEPGECEYCHRAAHWTAEPPTPNTLIYVDVPPRELTPINHNDRRFLKAARIVNDFES